MHLPISKIGSGFRTERGLFSSGQKEKSQRSARGAAFGSSHLQAIQTAIQNAVISRDLFCLVPESGNHCKARISSPLPHQHSAAIHVEDLSGDEPSVRSEEEQKWARRFRWA